MSRAHVARILRRIAISVMLIAAVALGVIWKTRCNTMRVRGTEEARTGKAMDGLLFAMRDVLCRKDLEISDAHTALEEARVACERCYVKPFIDGWGCEMRVRLVRGEGVKFQVWVQSAGRDGRFDTEDDMYRIGHFELPTRAPQSQPSSRVSARKRGREKGSGSLFES